MFLGHLYFGLQNLLTVKGTKTKMLFNWKLKLLINVKKTIKIIKYTFSILFIYLKYELTNWSTTTVNFGYKGFSDIKYFSIGHDFSNVIFQLK